MALTLIHADPWWGGDLLAGRPERDVWADVRREWTFGALRDRVDALNATYGAHGVRPGDTAVLHMAPSLTLLWSLLALWSRGARVVLVDHRAGRSRVMRDLARTRPRCYVRSDGALPGRFRAECGIRVEILGGGSAPSTPHRLLHLDGPSPVGRTGPDLLAETTRLSGLDGAPRAGERVLVLDDPVSPVGVVVGLLHSLQAGTTLVFGQHDDVSYALADTGCDVVFARPERIRSLSTAPHDFKTRPRLVVATGPVSEVEHDRFVRRHGVSLGRLLHIPGVGVVAADLVGAHRPPVVGPYCRASR
ncbi:AMP-binding protein [Saccharothrix australiensis]|uniref:AMP-binding enzyme n=1 Tax=Saccharothrix australiensis TaxID=2072 RepID=A0A495W151_9PSEU|nr:AMP-binding enzyme [Saccharothrix australiensis]